MSTIANLARANAAGDLDDLSGDDLIEYILVRLNLAGLDYRFINLG